MIIKVTSYISEKGVSYWFEVTTKDGKQYNDKTFYLHDGGKPFDKNILFIMSCGLIAQIASSCYNEEDLIIEFHGDGSKLNSVIENYLVDHCRERRSCVIDTLKKGVQYNIITVFQSEKDYIPFIEPDNAVMHTFSFGKESNLTKIICESVLPVEYRGGIFIEFGTYIRGLWKSHYEEYPMITPMVSNFNHINHFIKEINPDENYLGIRFNMSMPFIFLGVMYSNRLKYFLVGNEMGCDFISSDVNEDLYSFWDLYEEDHVMEMMMSICAQSIIKDARYFSAVTLIREDAIIKILHDGYHDVYQNLISCYFPKESKKYDEVCDKCVMYKGVIKKLGLTPIKELPMTGRIIDYDVDIDIHLSELKWIPSEFHEVLLKFYESFGLFITDEENPYTIYGTKEKWVAKESVTTVVEKKY